MEVKYCTVWLKWPIYNVEGSAGTLKLYDTFSEALEAAKATLKNKDKPYEWKIAVCEVEAVVSMGDPEVELAS